ncbi:Growth arrest-specific protein 2 [Halotydeus destructor]|nr:Growth arrest-specific protein 2 [Halotydeus destructor]
MAIKSLVGKGGPVGTARRDTSYASDVSADSGSSSPTVIEEDEDEYQEYMTSKTVEYSVRIAKLQEEYLIPLKEDLADWLNRVLGTKEIFVENFLEKLDNGVTVCKLARLIEANCTLDVRHEAKSTLNSPRKGSDTLSSGRHSLMQTGNDCNYKKQNQRHSFDGIGYVRANDDLVKINMMTAKIWENAKSQSFYARDNVCNFIRWCRYLGVREAVIFESEDLVLHNNQRNVVLCLLEVARIACTRYNFEISPGLVDLEQEIDREIEREAQLVCGELASQFGQGQVSPASSATTDRCPSLPLATDDSAAGSSEDAGCWSSEGLPSPRRSPSANSLVSSASMASSSVPSSSGDHQGNDNNDQLLISQLDQKVMLIAKSFYGKKLRHGVQRLSEGKYRIAGKIVFVRLLRDRHVMVRVGGGWDTLQHFLERHGGEDAPDISPSDLLPMDTRPSESRRRDQALHGLVNGTGSALNNILPDKMTSAAAGNNRNPVSGSSNLRRCVSTTPLSRRSSVSSPEPWSGSSICSSGYTSGSGTNRPPSRTASVSRRSSLNATPSPQAQSRIGTIKRRPLTAEANKNKVMNRSSLGLHLTPVNSPKATSAPVTPTRIPVLSSPHQSPPGGSGIKPPMRYPNYLNSSQHISPTPRSPNGGPAFQGTPSKVPSRRSSMRAF